ncbi:MAG: LysR family transcriptional regulator [Acidobacteria bacterium]|nr:LysR family transcriptional regulator [Acidobacteriota bacterium]
MHVETLRIFCDVVRQGSFSRGAVARSVSQSAASQAVRQLEKQLGAELIDRSTRPWELTAEGAIFFKGCQEIVERYHELEDAVRHHQDPSAHRVRVASIYSVGLQHLSQYVDQFRALVPGAAVDLDYMQPDQVRTRVLSDQSDLGLLSFAVSGRDLTAIPWKDQLMVVAFPPSHRLAALATSEGGIRPSELSGERFVALDRLLPVRREIDKFLRRHEVEVEITAEFDNIETVKQAVDEGAGIAILPEPTLRREAKRGTLGQARLLLAPGEPPLVRPLSIVHRRKRRLNQAVMEFIRLLLEDAGDTAAERDPASVTADPAGIGRVSAPSPSDHRTAAVVAARGAHV